MSSAYTVPPRRDLISRVAREIDDFMSWMLYGSETWLVALLKGVPLLLFIYFALGYVPNYANTITTLYLGFSKDVGFLVAVVLIGGPTFTLLLILALWTQAARGRHGFAWSLIRFLDFLQYVAVVLGIIPYMLFNLAGGSLIPPLFPLQALALGAIAVGGGASGLVYLWLEYRRISRREAEAAAAASAAWSSGG
jgi:fumarate reductase subunit D